MSSGHLVPEAACRASDDRRLRALLSFGTTRDLGAIQRDEVDRIEIEGREAAVAGHVRDNTPHIGEQLARAFDQQEGIV